MPPCALSLKRGQYAPFNPAIRFYFSFQRPDLYISKTTSFLYKTDDSDFSHFSAEGVCAITKTAYFTKKERRSWADGGSISMKTCRMYLNHIQRSVFEGMITDGQLNKLQKEIKKIININYDQVCIYKFNSLKYSCKEVLGTVEEIDNYM